MFVAATTGERTTANESASCKTAVEFIDLNCATTPAAVDVQETV